MSSSQSIRDPTSPTKRTLSIENKENDSPTKARKLTVLVTKEYNLPPDVDLELHKSEFLDRFTSDLESEKSKMSYASFNNSGRSTVLLSTSDGHSIATRLDNFGTRIQRLEQEAKVAKNMYQPHMDLIQGNFEEDLKKLDARKVDAEVSLRRNRAAHIPKLLPTLETFNQRNIYDKHKIRFDETFACDKDMAETLQDIQLWVKLVNYAALPIWSLFPLADDSMEMKFSWKVKQFNEDLKKQADMVAAIKEEEWQDRLIDLLSQGAKVEKRIKRRARTALGKELGEMTTPE